jgi:hypothetical protein
MGYVRGGRPAGQIDRAESAACPRPSGKNCRPWRGGFTVGPIGRRHFQPARGSKSSTDARQDPPRRSARESAADVECSTRAWSRRAGAGDRAAATRCAPHAAPGTPHGPLGRHPVQPLSGVHVRGAAAERDSSARHGPVQPAGAGATLVRPAVQPGPRGAQGARPHRVRRRHRPDLPARRRGRAAAGDPRLESSGLHRGAVRRQSGLPPAHRGGAGEPLRAAPGVHGASSARPMARAIGASPSRRGRSASSATRIWRPTRARS